jgi:TRAP-type C4-dicarboxylate transport system permease small subunit
MTHQIWAARVAHRVNAGVEFACKAILLVTGFCLLAVLVLNVIVRYILEGSMGELSELPSLLFPWFVMGGIVLAAVRGAHVAMQLTLHSLPSDGRRWLAIVIHAVSATVFLMLAWYSVENMVIAHDEKSTILHVPGSVGYAALVVAFLLVGVSSLTALLRYGVAREEIVVDLAADAGGIV